MGWKRHSEPVISRNESYLMKSDKLKRLMDISIASVLLIILLPVFLLVMFLIMTTMGRPVFFSHQRSGFKKEAFFLFKFRTMREKHGENIKDSERITPLGLFLRKYSIDEIPQLLNVILGHMSLVGPRPLLREYDSLYSDIQNQRFLVKPGITGLAQISGRNDINWNEKLSFDVEYVRSRTIRLDFMILLKTVTVVFAAKGFHPSGEASKFGAEE